MSIGDCFEIGTEEKKDWYYGIRGARSPFGIALEFSVYTCPTRSRKRPSFGAARLSQPPVSEQLQLTRDASKLGGHCYKSSAVTKATSFHAPALLPELSCRNGERAIWYRILDNTALSPL